MPLLLTIPQVKQLQRKSKRTRRKSKRTRRLRPVKTPAAAERLLRKKTENLWKEVIFPSIERIKAWIQSGMPLDMLSTRIQQELDQTMYVYGLQSEVIVDMWRLAVDKITRAKINAALKSSLGIDLTGVLDDPQVHEHLIISSQVAEDLIRTMPTKVYGQVADAVMRNMRGEPLPDGRTLLQEIEAIGTKSQKWAKVIARDQTSKLTASLNQVRQQSLGIEMYVWRTMQDRRVVGRPDGLYPSWNDKHKDHYIMEGLWCRWDDATVYSIDEGKTWRQRTSKMPKNHPATDILCRCYPEPQIDIDAVIARAQLM